MCQMVWELINCKGFYEATDFDAFFKAHLIYFRFQANLFNINKLTAKKKKKRCPKVMKQTIAH